MIWPLVAKGSPGTSALRLRKSKGSMSRAAANLSICASWPTQTWTAPKPRIAPQGGLLVRTPTPSINTESTLYGPAAKEEAFPRTAVVVEA